MQRYKAGLASGSPNGEDTFGRVQVLGVEIQRFTEPEAG